CARHEDTTGGYWYFDVW
nr:immunoglobulin heavy chain junction region [Mus musculus]MBK4184464.1 immunoglobulin heavy chain junction region [Mus musculus]